jgi:hypothetical protein
MLGIVLTAPDATDLRDSLARQRQRAMHAPRVLPSLEAVAETNRIVRGVVMVGELRRNLPRSAEAVPLRSAKFAAWVLVVPPTN